MKIGTRLHVIERFRRAILIAVGLSGIVLVPVALLPWLQLIATTALFHRAAVGFLVALELAYFLSIAASTAGSIIFGLLVVRSRNRGKLQPGPAQGLLLCLSLMTSLAAAEAVTAAVLGMKSSAAVGSRIPGLAVGDPQLPLRFEDKPASEVRLVVLGESSAVGFPCQEWLSIGRVVTWGLERSIPSRRFSLQTIAHEGDTLEDQHRALSRLERRPDAIIVYCGHNEFAKRYPPHRDVGHYLDKPRRVPFWELDSRLGVHSALCTVIRHAIDKRSVGIPPSFRSARPLVDVPVFSEADSSERLADFRHRLEVIASYCEQIGALLVLVVPPGNDADFEPNRSYLPRGTPPEQRDAFSHAFLAVKQRESIDAAGCIESYKELLNQQPGFAEAHFRLARLLRQAGHWEEAYQHFVAARDLDGFPVRCIGPLQQAYRDVAQSHDAVLVDGQELFHVIGEHGLLDDRLFHDAMHPSVRGHIALGQAVLQALYERRAFGWSDHSPPPRLDYAECESHFGLDSNAWKILCDRGAMFYYGTASSRYDPSERLAKLEAFRQGSRRISEGAPPRSIGLPNIGLESRSLPER